MSALLDGLNLSALAIGWFTQGALLGIVAYCLAVVVRDWWRAWRWGRAVARERRSAANRAAQPRGRVLHLHQFTDHKGRVVHTTTLN